MPELIWKKALSVFNLNNFSNIVEIDLKFLAALMKYGSILSYTKLKNELITHINENSNSNSTISVEMSKITLDVEINNCILCQYRGRVTIYL